MKKGLTEAQIAALSRDEKVSQFSRLVWQEAIRCWRGGYGRRLWTLEDCAQVGFTALLKAIDGFDPARGCKFITYATMAIRNTLSRACSDNLIIHVNNKTQIDASRHPDARSEVLDAARRAMKITRAHPGFFRHAIPVEAPSEGAPDEWDRVKQALGRLPKRQAEILHLRFMRGWTQEATGREFGVTKERARQLQNEALERMRVMLNAAGATG